MIEYARTGVCEVDLRKQPRVRRHQAAARPPCPVELAPRVRQTLGAPLGSPPMPSPPNAPPVSPDPKPTFERVAWVFRCLLANLGTYQSFRGLIYETMGYDERAYFPLFVASGQEVASLLYDASASKA